MKLDEILIDRINWYDKGVLAILDDGGYPYSIVTEFEIKKETNAIELIKPKSLKQQITPNQKACFLFHYHDENLNNLRQEYLKGIVNEKDTKLIFFPSHVSGFNQKGIKYMIKFVREGKKATKKYFKQRGIKPPKLKYE